MTSREVADKLGVSPSTVRRWADVFEAFLSPTAKPPKGEVRHFTEEDLELLVAVAYYSKEQHLKYQAILDKLRRGDHKREVIPTPAELRPAEKPADRPAPTEVPVPRIPSDQYDQLFHELRDLVQVQRRQQEALREQISALEERLDSISSRLAPLRDVQGQLGRLQEGVSRLADTPVMSADDLEARLASLGQLEEVLAELTRLRGVIEAQATQISELAQLRETVEAQAARQRRGAWGALAMALGTGNIGTTLQLLSWVVLLLAALGLLYYLNLDRPATVVLALVITVGLWLAGRLIQSPSHPTTPGAPVDHP